MNTSLWFVATRFAYLIVVSTLLLTNPMGASAADELRSVLPGTWRTGHSSSPTVPLLVRAEQLGEEYGIAFKADGTLVERKDAGWCGTPPISYGNYSGTWRILENGKLEVLSGYWGGTMRTTYEVSILNRKELGWKMINQEIIQRRNE